MKRGKGTIFVGLSGGVDSSVSALRLQNDGYTVIGVFIKTWVPDFLHCNIEAERLDAMRVAATLGIPLYTFDAEEAYRVGVAEYMIAEYTKGRTPNPDVMCNKFVKFGAFLEYAIKEGADGVATGHYAQVKHIGDSYRLLRGADKNKDQSYFLWTLTQKELGKILFPVGNSVKSGIRHEAERYSLPTATKSDSQGICFLGQVDIQEFLAHYVETRKGDVLDESNVCIGRHSGALFYTMGQRHGFTVETVGSESVPHYVIAKDLEKNTITVARSPQNVSGRQILLSEINEIAGPFPERCEAQFRYRQKPFAVTTSTDGVHGMLITVLDSNIEIPSPGQSCVLYRGDECLGGGIINAIL